MAIHVGPNTSHRQGYKIASAVPADSSENVQLSQRNDGPEPATIASDCSLRSTKGKYSRIGTTDTTKVPIRIKQFPIELTRINGFWLKKMCFWTYLPWFLKSTIFKKDSIIWKNEHNFTIICPPKEQSYWHNMLLFLAQSIKAYFRDPIIQNLPGEHAPDPS